MPNVLSRLAAHTFGLRILPAECHEISHPWHPHCFWALRDPLLPAWLFCLRTYGTLYTLKALLDRRGRVDRIDWARVLLNTLRSSTFLTTTEILFLVWLCIFRKTQRTPQKPITKTVPLSLAPCHRHCSPPHLHFLRFMRLFGFATWPTVSVLNAFVACSMSIWIESKARRALLVPYLLNLASEALFRQAQNRGLIRRSPPPFAHAQALLFGLSLAVAAAILSKKLPNGKKSARSADFWHSILNKTVGFTADVPCPHQKGRISTHCGARDINCSPNSHYECALRALKLSLKNFSLSLAALTLLKLFGAVRSAGKPSKVPFAPSAQFTKKLLQHIRLPTFIGVLPLFCQFSQCLCIRFFPTKSVSICRPIGIGVGASVAMAFLWPNNTLALYAFWKMVELAFFRLADAGIVPVLPCGDALLFSLVSSYLLGLAVLEPHALRPNYYKFLCSVTGDRLQLLNRPMLDAFFGTSSCTVLHRNYRPNFVPHLRTINPAQYLTPAPINKQ